MFHMFLFVSGEDENIVKVNYIKYVNVALKRTVNIGLKSGRGISQTKGHNKKLKVAILSSKGRFPLISFAYSYPIVGVP